MKLLYLTTTMDVGGIETNLVTLGSALRARGHDVTVASSGGSLVAELERGGVRHIALPLSLRDPRRLAWAAVRLARIVRRERPDLVHAMSAAGNVAALFAPRGATRYVSSPMGLQMSAREPGPVTIVRNLLLTLRAERVLLESEEIRRQVEVLRLPAKRLVDCDLIAIVPERFNATPEQAAAVRAELGLGDAPVVTTIGALEPRKNHELFLEAAALVRSGMPGTRFLVVGEGAEHAALLARSASLGLSDALLFTGRRRDVGAILAATDVYVKPGIVEGFIGITVLEAMAAWKPVVAFDTRDVRAVLADGETGLIVAPGDHAALARAIERLLRDRALASELANRGHQRALERFAIGPVVARLEETYRSLLAGAA